MITNIALRGAATESVVQRFREEAFSWEGPHCITLAHAQGTAMGHDLPPVPKFRTVQGARRALKRRGAASTAELLDLWFERRPAPAFAQVGDLVVLPADEELPGVRDELAAIGIADGQGNIFGWHGSDPTRLSTIKFAAAQVRAAWAL